MKNGTYFIVDENRDKPNFLYVCKDKKSAKQVLNKIRIKCLTPNEASLVILDVIMK